MEDKKVDSSQNEHKLEKDFQHEIEEMLSNTSCLAIGNIILRENPIRKCLWCIGFIICTLLTIIQLYSLSISYFEYPLNTVIKIKTSPVDFPRITLCNLNPIRRSKLLSHASDGLKNFLLNLENKTFKIDNENEFKSRIEDERKFDELYEMESRETRMKMGHQLKDFILQCSFLGVKCDLDKLFQPIITVKYGNCFLFDPFRLENYKERRRKIVRRDGLFVTFYLQTEEYLQNFIASSGVRIHFHEPGSIELPENYGYNLPPGYEISLGIQPNIIRKKSEIKGNCDNGTAFQSKYNSTYTRQSCVFVCLQEIIYSKCNCYQSTFYPYNNNSSRNYCSSEKEVKCLLDIFDDIKEVDELCSCSPSCHVTLYDIRQSLAKWPTQTYESRFFNDLRDVYPKFNDTNKLKSKYHARQNLTNAIIYMSDDFYREVYQIRSYKLDNYLSDIGGTLGLYLGFSVLTGFEFLEVIMMILNHFYRRVRMKSVSEKTPLLTETDSK